MYKFIFIDLDDTILDFGAAERMALGRAYREAGIDTTDALLQRYARINQDYWEAYERGEISRDRLLVERHAALFREYGISMDPETVELEYRRYLGMGHFFIEGAEDCLRYLKSRGCRLFLASNGIAETQYSRLRSAGIGPYFEQIFISEETGYHKPERAYFDYWFARIDGFDRASALLLGDSISSDIRGGKAAGLATCWFNPKQKPIPPDCVPDYVIHHLSELRQIL